MEARAKRIIESAVALAEEGGFEAVRLRDVAAHAEVALGTLYRRFRSKEDILVAALDQETLRMEARILRRAPKGESVSARVVHFFDSATRALCRRPNLARAVLRAVTSGDPTVTEKAAAFHMRMTELTCSVIGDRELSDDERTRAFLLQQIWFAGLVGWMGGLHSKAAIVEQIRVATPLLFED